MILWQANLGRGVSSDEFEHNLRRLLAIAGPRAVICLQEIDEADQPQEMDTVIRLARMTHRIVGRSTAVPILVPRHLDLIGAVQTPACKGLALFTPNRIVNEAVVRLGPDLVVTILNTHVPLLRPQTLTRRRQVRKTLRRRTRNHDHGIWVADTNTRRGWPTMADGERSVIEAGIDKAKAWSGRRVVVSRRQSLALTIDNHDAHGARVMFESGDA